MNKCPVYDVVSTIARVHAPRNQGLERGIVSLTITPSDPLGKFLLPVPVTLSSRGFDSRGGCTPASSHINIPLNWKLRLPLATLGFQCPETNRLNKGITVLGGVSDPDYHGEMGLLLHSRGKKEYV